MNTPACRQPWRLALLGLLLCGAAWAEDGSSKEDLINKIRQQNLTIVDLRANLTKALESVQSYAASIADGQAQLVLERKKLAEADKRLADAATAIKRLEQERDAVRMINTELRKKLDDLETKQKP